jgi:hypothetical protein
MRQVRALAAVLARVLRLRDAGQPAQVLAETNRALHDLTGADSALLAVIAPATLIEWIQRDANPAAAQELLRAAIPLLCEHAAALDAASRTADAAAFRAHVEHFERYLTLD